VKRALLIPLVLFASAAVANDNLDRCRDSEAEFDYQGVLAECTLAVSEDLSVAEKIDAYKLLGFANTALGKPRPGREWFMRLLAIDPEFSLGAEISPRFRKNFDKARREFLKNAKVSVSHTPVEAPKRFDDDGPPLALGFVAVDKAKLIASASVAVEVTWEGLDAPLTEEVALAIAREGGNAKITGGLPDPARSADSVPEAYSLTYRLRILNGAGKELKPESGGEPVTLEMKGPAPPFDFGVDPMWLLVGGGAAVAVTSVVVGTVVVCGSGVCTPRFQTPPVGGVSVGIAR
jgi:hypothetical protein